MLPISNIFKYIKYCPYIEYIDGMRLDNSEYMAEYCPYLMLVIVVLPIAVLLAVQHSTPNDLHLKSIIKATTKSNYLAFRFC